MSDKRLNTIKLISGLLIISVTALCVWTVAQMSKTYSRTEIIETPNYTVDLVGGFIVDPYYTYTDQGATETVETSDGGWITGVYNTSSSVKPKIVKYNANGTIQWEKEFDLNLYSNTYLVSYFDQEGEHEEHVYPYTSYSHYSSQIVQAADGGYFVNFHPSEWATFKLDKDGNVEWQSETAYSSYFRHYHAVCPYEGNTNEQGKVKDYTWDSSTDSISGGTWYRDLYEWERKDDTSYYCGYDNNRYYNYYYTGSGRIKPLPDGGFMFLTAMSLNPQYNDAVIRLSDGTIRNYVGQRQILIYDKNGKLVDNIDTVPLYREANNAFKEKYGVTTEPSQELIRDQSTYHDYIGAYPNGDILMIFNPGRVAVKVRKNTTTGKYEPIWFMPLGFNGYWLGNFYSNADGELDVKLLDDGGFVIKPQYDQYLSKNGTKQEYYNTELTQYDLFLYNQPQSDIWDYLPNASWIFRYGEKDAAGGGKQAYLAQMLPYTTSWRDARYDADLEPNGDIYRIYGYGGGSGYYPMDDGSYIVSLYYGSYKTNHEHYRRLKLASGEEITISDQADLLVYRITPDMKIQWIKQFKGMSNYPSSNPKVRLSSDKKHLLVPIKIGRNQSIYEIGSDETSTVLTNTASSDKYGFLIFGMGYDREEREIPDPTTTEATTESTTKGSVDPTPTTKKTTKKTKKGETTTTEETTTTTTEATTTSTTTTTKKTTTTTQKEEVKGDETPKKDIKKIVLIAIGGLGGLFIVGIGFYFIPIVFFGKKKVLIGMSGNTDSSVAAKLLLDRNYKVSALFINNGMNVEGLTYAKQICNKLGIDLYEQDITGEYKAKVEEAKSNPNADLDSIYNKYILVDILKAVAKEQHIKYISCGVYARKQSGTIVPGVNNVFDESGKLSLLTPEDIKNLVLPLGEIDYQEVNKIAAKNALNLSNKKQTPEEKIGM